MNILVTGATGFIGSHLAEHLVALGHSVRGVDCLTDYYSRSYKEAIKKCLENMGVAFFVHDLEEDTLDSVFRNMDVVYHLATQPGISATCTLLVSFSFRKIVGSPLLGEVSRWV